MIPTADAMTVPELAEEARRRFRYDPETGLLYYRTPTRRRRPGDRAGSLSPNGYIQVSFAGRTYPVHRLVWLMTYGEWPRLQLDHKDNTKTNNRIDNLREATRGQNIANSRCHRDSTVPVKGVRVHARGRYQARIMVDGKGWSLGCYSTPEEAHAAYVEAAKALFGAFARAG